jgi:hypothetical protein
MNNSNSKGNIAIIFVIILVVLAAIWFFAKKPAIDTLPTDQMTTEQSNDASTDQIQNSGTSDAALDMDVETIDKELINLGADAQGAFE